MAHHHKLKRRTAWHVFVLSSEYNVRHDMCISPSEMHQMFINSRKIGEGVPWVVLLSKHPLHGRVVIKLAPELTLHAIHSIGKI